MSERNVPNSTLFSDSDDGCCVVCDRELPTGVSNYCSDYCSSVGTNVGRLFSFSYVRKLVLDRDGGECVRCGDEADVVDHIIALSRGGHPFDPANLQSLCDDCHYSKQGIDADFMPGRDGGVELGYREVANTAGIAEE